MTLNKKQRRTIIIGITIIFLMMLIPPWRTPGTYSRITDAGYGFIFASDVRYRISLTDGFVYLTGGPVNLALTTLIIQCFAVAALTALLAFIFNKPQK
jgi:hypothetical protein